MRNSELNFFTAGLNRDTWHSVTVRIDVHGARLLAKVDDTFEEIDLLGLHKSSNYGISTDLTSVVLIGGKIWIVAYYKTVYEEK